MSDKTPAVLVDQASKWYGEVIGINDVSLEAAGCSVSTRGLTPHLTDGADMSASPRGCTTG